MDEVLVVDRCKALGVSVSQQELFHLCVAICVAGIARYGDAYTQPHVWSIPAYAQEVADHVIREHGTCAPSSK